MAIQNSRTLSEKELLALKKKIRRESENSRSEEKLPHGACYEMGLQNNRGGGKETAKMPERT